MEYFLSWIDETSQRQTTYFVNIWKLLKQTAIVSDIGYFLCPFVRLIIKLHICPGNKMSYSWIYSSVFCLFFILFSDETCGFCLWSNWIKQRNTVSSKIHLPSVRLPSNQDSNRRPQWILMSSINNPEAVGVVRDAIGRKQATSWPHACTAQPMIRSGSISE